MTQQWFGGLPVVGTRELTAEELAHLETMRDDAKSKLWQSLGAITLFIGGAVAALFLMILRSVLIWFAIWAVFFAQRRKSWPIGSLARFVWRSRTERTHATVAICEGADTRIEVLTQSGLLWTHDGVQKYEIVILPGTTTATVPDHAHMAVHYLAAAEGAKFATHQRPLSDAEVAELAGYMPSVPLRHSLGLALSVAFMVASIIGMFRIDGSLILFALVGMICVARVAPLVWRTLRARATFQRDLNDRRAVILRRVGEENAFEVLLHSGVLWTEAGEPALWRRLLPAQ